MSSLTMFVRAKSTRIQIDVRVDFDHSDFYTAAF